MPITIGDGLAFCGRPLTEAELGLIRGITREFANLAWTELAATICELLEWRRPNGGLKSRECYLFLRELHRRGWLPWLTAPQLRSRRTPLAKLTAGPAPSPNLLTGPLDHYRPIHLQLIQDADQRRLFREYLDRYHYLGYRAPYGAQLRYWVRPAQPELPPLAALLFTSAAWRMAPRDRWIGWSDSVRQRNLPLVVNHSRFLILPWGQIPQPRQSYPVARRATVARRLAGALRRRARAAGNPGGPGALPRHLLPRGQLAGSRADPGTRTHGSWGPRRRHPQTDLLIPAPPPLAPAPVRAPARATDMNLPPTPLPCTPQRVPNGPPPEGPSSLLACFLDIVADWEPLFPQPRTYLRAVRQALGTLICLGRRTLTRIIWANGGQHKDWRAEYFLFSRCQWNPAQLFTPIVQRALAWCPGRYIGVAIDDTRLRKTGLRIQQAFYQRDPLSPKFYVNLMFGLRFLQASLLVPLFRRAKVGTRALPIAFEEVSVVKRPRRKLPKRKTGKGKRTERPSPRWSRNGNSIGPPKRLTTSPPVSWI